MLRRQFASGYFFEKTIVHCLIFREDNSPVLRRQLYSAQFMVKITVFREDNQPVLHLQRRQSASASHFEKTILPVLKKTILLEKTILPFPAVTVKRHNIKCISFQRLILVVVIQSCVAEDGHSQVRLTMQSSLLYFHGFFCYTEDKVLWVETNLFQVI